jgi:hypothetical protein
LPQKGLALFWRELSEEKPLSDKSTLAELRITDGALLDLLVQDGNPHVFFDIEHDGQPRESFFC